MERHVSNHRTAIDDIRDSATHIGNAVHYNSKRMEFLLESITSQDNYLHDAMGNIRADSNGIRSDFEGASIHLLEVDLYQRSTESNPTKPNPGKVSAVTFYRGGKTRVDLCWHTRQEFRNISTDHKDELKSCQGSNEGKSYIKNKQTINRKKRKSDLDNSEKENWRKKLKKSINGQSRISHVMSNMREEETNNSSLAAAIVGYGVGTGRGVNSGVLLGASGRGC